MHRERIIFGYLFGFLMAIILVLLSLLLILKFTVGDKNYILKILNDNNYYQKVDNEIEEEMSLYILSSGFTDEIYKDVYKYDDLVNDINKYIDSVYSGEVITLDTETIRNNINENVKAFFKNSKETYNNSDLVSFIDGLVNVYSDEVSLYHFPDDVIKYVPKILKLINTGIIITSILLVVLLIILVIIKYHYFIASIISSGLIILFIRLAIFERIDVDELLIITENFSEELRIVLSNLQNLMFVTAISIIIFGGILLIVKLICQPKKRRDENIEIL